MTPVELAVALVALNGPSKQTIWVNPEEIVSIRAPRSASEHHFVDEIDCVLQTADGKLINVVNDCDEVRARLGKPLVK